MKKFISILISLLLASSAGTLVAAEEAAVTAIAEEAAVEETAVVEEVVEEVALEKIYKGKFVYSSYWLEKNTIENVVLEKLPAINTTLIGAETGWGDNADTGRAAAFDGNTETFFDPQNMGVDYAGVDAGAPVIITKLLIHPRNDQLGRFNGATIEAANNEDFSDAVTLFVSSAAAEEAGYIDCTDSIIAENNNGYRYFRYINYTEHGDVAEVELYGYVVPAAAPAAVEEAEEAVEEVIEEVAEEVVEEPVAEEVVVETANKAEFVYNTAWVDENKVENAVLVPVPVVEEVAEEVEEVEETAQRSDIEYDYKDIVITADHFAALAANLGLDVTAEQIAALFADSEITSESVAAAITGLGYEITVEEVDEAIFAIAAPIEKYDITYISANFLYLMADVMNVSFPNEFYGAVAEVGVTPSLLAGIFAEAGAPYTEADIYSVAMNIVDIILTNGTPVEETAEEVTEEVVAEEVVAEEAVEETAEEAVVEEEVVLSNKADFVYNTVWVEENKVENVVLVPVPVVEEATEEEAVVEEAVEEEAVVEAVEETADEAIAE